MNFYKAAEAIGERGHDACSPVRVKNGFFEPYTSEKFKETVKNASDTELAIAEIFLIAARDRGAKVKRRLQSVSLERRRRA